MEGPSIFLAVEQLSPFIGQTIKGVRGNTKIGKERLLNKQILSIFSYGKQLLFQFDTFALRVHFLLFGTFEATIYDKKVTGDYPKKAQTPRLVLELKIGHIDMYHCSILFIENSNVRELYDFTTDVMSDTWDAKKALTAVQKHGASEIADVLLDQTIFTGVGNIIKNEVLLLAKTSPLRKVEELSLAKLKKIISLTRAYVFQFYEWRKQFILRKNYNIYRQSTCKLCGSKVMRKKTGMRHRISYICPVCEK